MKKGFTLLELLIGITIFAVISGAVYSSLYLGIKVYKHEQKSNALSNEIVLTFSILENNLYSVFMNPDDQSITFKGSPERVEFFNVSAKGELEQAGFYLEPSGEPLEFELLMFKKRYSKLSEENEQKIELINNKVRSLKLSYFDSEQNLWYEDWPEELSVPNQIKIEIEFIDPKNSENVIKMEKYISIPIANSIEYAVAE